MRGIWKGILYLLMAIGALIVIFVTASWTYNAIVQYEAKIVAWPAADKYLPPAKWQPDNPRRIRILSIDGGALLGIGSLEILKFFEQKSGKPISELFDFVAGTSTGSIIATSLLVPDGDGHQKYDVDEILEDYIHLSKTILNSPLYHKILTVNGLVGPRLLNRAKLVSAHRLFADTRFGQLLRPAIVTAIDRRRDALHVFSNWQKPAANIFVGPLVAAATAAPTYFPAVELDGDPKLQGIYSDGGLIANDPAHRAFFSAVRLYPDARFVIVSVGSRELTTISPRASIQGGLVEWLIPLFKTVFRGQDQVVNFAFDSMRTLKTSFAIDYFRFAPTFPKGTNTFSPTNANIELIGRIGRDYVAKNSGQLEKALSLLIGTAEGGGSEAAEANDPPSKEAR